jgi:hypothetical protein
MIEEDGEKEKWQLRATVSGRFGFASRGCTPNQKASC